MGYKTFFEQIKTVCAWNSLMQGAVDKGRDGNAYVMIHLCVNGG